MNRIKKNNIDQKENEREFYDSLEEWQAKNFPNLKRERTHRKPEKQLKALGNTIADNIAQRIKSQIENSET